MNEAIKREWVEALRSGKYQQGKGALCEHQRYCCLGVLSDVLKDRIGAKWDGGHLRVDGETHSAYLPSKAMDLAELDDRDPLVQGKRLSRWNDTGATFPEIADLIEQHL